MAQPQTLLLATALTALLVACGEDPENRQALMDSAGPPEGGEMILIPNGQANQAQGPPDAGDAPRIRIEDIEGDAGLENHLPIPQTYGEDRESIVVDTAPNDLIDSAQGFAPEPMDDASGLDPSPSQDNDWSE